MKAEPPIPKSEFEGWVIRAIVALQTDMSWVKKFMWVLAAIVAASVGVKLL